MSSSPDDAMIEAALHDFSRQFHMTFPLRNFGEFHDEDDEQLKEKILQLKEGVSKKIFSQVWNRDSEEVFSLLKKLRERMNKEVIAEWLAKNKMHTIESVSFLQSRAEMFCEDFQMGLEDHLLLNLQLDMDSFKNYVDREKMIAVNYFDGIWKPRNSQIKDERKAKMGRLLDMIGEEVIEKHKHFLESKSVDKGKKLEEEVKTILVEKVRQLKSYVDKHPRRMSKRFLKAEVEDIKEYLLNGKGSTLRESEEEIYSKLVETLEGGITFLTEEGLEGNAHSQEDLIHWIEGFHLKLKSYCSNGERGWDETKEITLEKHGSNGCDSDNPQRSCINMQKILRNDPCCSWDQELLEPESRTDEAGGGGNANLVGESGLEKGEEIYIVDKTKSKVDDRPKPANAASIITRLLRSRPLRSSVPVKSQRVKNKRVLAASNESPLPKKLRTGGNVFRKTIEKADTFVLRQRSRGNDKAGVSSQPMPSRRSSRLQKNSVEPNLTKETIGDRVDATIKSSLSLHGEQQIQQNREDEQDSMSSGILEDSSPRQPESNNGDTESSESDSRESRDLGRSNLTACPNLITILGGDPPTFKCEVCKRVLKTKDSFKFHGNLCWRARREHKCDHCSKRFSAKAELVNHIRIHTGEKPFKCPTCDKRFKQKCHLLAHIRSHTEEACFICGKCKRGFRQRCNLNRHMLIHEENLPFGCSYCERRCATMARLMEHVIAHSDERPYNCITCNKPFSLKHQLTRHIQRFHRQSKEDADKQVNDAALEYLRKVTKNPDYDGDISSIVVLTHAVKKANLSIPDEMDRTTSSTEVIPSRGSSRHKLPICLARITNLGGNPPTYKCDVCKSDIKMKRSLKFHGRNCRMKRHKCDHCGKQFYNTSHLVVHLRTHTGEKPFKCPTCSKQFAHKSNLKSHMRSQARSGKRPFACEKYERSSARRGTLSSHMLRHKGKLQLFSCSYCDKRCSTMTRLKEHNIINHCDERPYECPTCEKSFSCKQNLVRHIQGLHQQPKEAAMRLANEAAAEYLRKENQVFVDTVSYSRIESVVLSHVIKKANLKLCELPSPSHS